MALRVGYGYLAQNTRRKLAIGGVHWEKITHTRLKARGPGPVSCVRRLKKSEFQAMTHPDLRRCTDNSAKGFQILFNEVNKPTVQTGQGAGA